MKEKVKSILFGVFALVFSVLWFTVLSDWQLMLFHVIPLNNVVAGIVFALIGVVSLLSAFASGNKKKEDKE